MPERPTYILADFRSISGFRYPVAKSCLSEHSDHEVQDKGRLDPVPETQGDLCFHLGIMSMATLPGPGLKEAPIKCFHTATLSKWQIRQLLNWF